MAKMNIADSFQTPFSMMGQSPTILIPALIASIVGLMLGFAFRGLGWFFLLGSIISYLVTLFCMGWTTYLIKDMLSGYQPTLQNGWTDLTRQGSSMWITFLIVAVAVSLGSIFFVIPGILLAALFLITIPESAITNHSFDRSIQFSFNFLFNQGNFLPFFLLVLVGFALTLIPLIGLFAGNLFLSIWIPYAYLKYGEE